MKLSYKREKMLHRGIRIAQFAVTARLSCTHNLRFAAKRIVCPSLRPESTLVGCDRHEPTDIKHVLIPWQKVIYASDAVAEKHVTENMHVYEDFISEDEEKSLINEVEPYLKRLRYETDHWDDVSVFSVFYGSDNYRKLGVFLTGLPYRNNTCINKCGVTKHRTGHTVRTGPSELAKCIIASVHQANVKFV